MVLSEITPVTQIAQGALSKKITVNVKVNQRTKFKLVHIPQDGSVATIEKITKISLTVHPVRICICANSFSRFFEVPDEIRGGFGSLQPILDTIQPSWAGEKTLIYFRNIINEYFPSRHCYIIV